MFYSKLSTHFCTELIILIFYFGLCRLERLVLCSDYFDTDGSRSANGLRNADRPRQHRLNYGVVFKHTYTFDVVTDV